MPNCGADPHIPDLDYFRFADHPGVIASYKSDTPARKRIGWRVPLDQL
jgi:hypothetical protein